MKYPPASKGTVRSGGEWKLPIKDADQARNALARENQVKPRPSKEDLRHMARVAESKIGHSTEKTREILGKSPKKS